MDFFQYEKAAKQRGFSRVCGCDEAGAGPLAGPVYAAAVILPVDADIPGLDDSKKLTSPKRDELFARIPDLALAYAVASVSPQEIDASDILSARMKAMQLAMDALESKADFALIDGNRDKGKSFAIKTTHQMIVKGDSLSASIAAASILAKVSRDRVMDAYAKQYPQYGFERHKGYPTKLHYEALREFGPCPIHRKSFLKKL